MRKENVSPTRRSIIPTLSLNKCNVYLNTDFVKTFYKEIKQNDYLYITYQKKGKKFYLIVSKVKIQGMIGVYPSVHNCKGRGSVQVGKFSELKSSDVARYQCIPVKTTLKRMDVYELKPYAFDSVKSLQFFDFKIKI